MNRSVESNRANCIFRRTIRFQCHRLGELSPSLKLFSGNRTSGYQIRALDECFLERRLTNSIELNRGHGTSIQFSNGSCFPSFLLPFFPPPYLLSTSNRRCSFPREQRSPTPVLETTHFMQRGRRANWMSKRSQASRHSDPASNTVAAYSIDFPSSLWEWTMVAVRIPDGWDPRFVSLGIERLFLFSSRYRACVVERSREACVRERERR